jgi:hypothetical protein
MMRLLKKTFLPPTHDLYQVNMRGLPADVLSGFEEMLLPACKTEAFNPLTVPKGEIHLKNGDDGTTMPLAGESCFLGGHVFTWGSHVRNLPRFRVFLLLPGWGFLSDRAPRVLLLCS